MSKDLNAPDSTMDGTQQASSTVVEAEAERTFDDRCKYRIRFVVSGHRHDELFLSLAEVQQFAAKYVVEHGLRIRDLQIIDSFSNVREWRSVSKKTLNLSKPRLYLSSAGAVFLSRYLEIVNHVEDLDLVKVGHDGKVFVSDPAPDWPDRHRVVGNVDDMLRDFVKKWNAGIARAFSEEDVSDEGSKSNPAGSSANLLEQPSESDDR